MDASTLSEESTFVGTKVQDKATTSNSSQGSTAVAISSSSPEKPSLNASTSLPSVSSSAVVPSLLTKSFKDVTILIDSLDEG
eukprot:gene40015-52838_t